MEASVVQVASAVVQEMLARHQVRLPSHADSQVVLEEAVVVTATKETLAPAVAAATVLVQESAVALA